MSNFAAFTKSNHTFLEGLVFRGLKDNPLTSSSIFNISGRLVKLEYPAVMGIINLSPDSFYSTSSVTEEEQIEIRIREMIGEGVDILDIGAASSKPGSKAIPVELETERIAKAVKIARQISPEVLISVDTYRASVAAKHWNWVHPWSTTFLQGFWMRQWFHWSKAQVYPISSCT
ncbi:MAG: dihydropteroate synthase [Saprospiraceae bacterium]|nr:dihydropteroate synthase [Candidatus Vicinibacter affinis]